MEINYNELMDFSNIKAEEDTSKIDEIIEYEEILFEISNSLKKYRKDHKLTQKQFAKLLDMDQVMISKLESGNYNPTFKQVYKISRKLTNSVDLFLDILGDIIDNFNQIYKTTYECTLKNEKYNNKESEKVIYMEDYTFYNLKGEEYGTEKCTSIIPIAG